MNSSGKFICLDNNVKLVVFHKPEFVDWYNNPCNYRPELPNKIIVVINLSRGYNECLERMNVLCALMER